MAAGTTIQHKRKAGAFTGGQLAAGEIGVDTTNGALYFSTDGATVATLTPHAAVTLGASLTDVLSISGQVLSAVDAGSDMIKFWDDSAGKETYATIGAGLSMAATTLTAKVANVWVAESTSTFSTAAVIAVDNSIPQSSEGLEIITKTLVPSSTGNYLKISFFGEVDGSTTNKITIAFFKDSETNATHASVTTFTGANYTQSIAVTFLIQVASTSSQTWKVRAGTNAGTAYLNQGQAGAIFSTSDKLTFLIEEVTLS